MKKNTAPLGIKSMLLRKSKVVSVKTFKKRRLILFGVLLFCLGLSYSQATITNSAANATDLRDQILGIGVSVTSPQILYGATDQFGTFENGVTGANLQLESGIFLTTGDVATAFTSNDQSGTTVNQVDGGPDPDLNLIDSTADFDTAAFQFDFATDGDGVVIEYQFASDEYPEYVCSRFNDAFGFFVSGGDLASTQNIALLPNNAIVSVNTINNGTSGTAADGTACDFSQSGLHIDNNNGAVGPVFIEYDGISVKLFATLPLTSGVTYTMKMALADVGDSSLDSGVFIKVFRAAYDSDGDGKFDAVNDLDDDNDGILDTVESGGVDPDTDTDGDNVPLYLDDDDNNAAIGDVNNAVESTFDNDGDGIANHLDDDSDGDMCSDANEAYNLETADADGNGYFGTGNPPATNSDGTVIGASYSTPIDTNANLTQDFLEIGPNTDNDANLNGCDPDDDNDGNPDVTDPNDVTATANNDLLTVVEGTTATVNVLTNDDFVPGVNTSITQTGGTAMGTVAFDPLTGELDYTPAAGEEGTTVTVIYQVCHTGVAPNVCEDATVNITVQTDTDDDGTPDVTDTDDDNDGNPDVSDPNPLVPTTMDDLLSVVEGATATVNVLTNDDFVPGVNTSITQTGGTAMGTVAFDPLTGELDYTPAAGEEGTTVTVIYQVCHTGVAPNVCEDATVNITVQTDTDDDGTPDVTDTDDDNDGNPDVSDPNPLVPTTMDDLLTVVEGTTATVNVLTNDDFVPGVNTSITQTGGTAMGTVAFDPLTGELDYRPAAGEEGTTVTVIYQVCHTGVAPNVCEDATVNITVQTDTDDDGTPDVTDTDDDNDGNPDVSDPNPLVPTTMDDLLTVVEGTTATVNVLTNDDFVPGANTSITQTGGTAMGTVVFDPLTGELDYTPAAGEEGTIVTVIYQVCHTGVAPNVCENATVNITVQTDTDDDGTPDVTDTDDDNDGNPDVSDPNPLVPTTMDDLLSVVEGTTATVNVLTNDDFVPGANTSITQTGGTATGTVAFDPLTGELDYTPAAGEEGTTVTVIYQVCHTGVAPNVCEDATVNITVQTDTDDDGTPDVTDTDDDNDGNPDVSDPNPLVPTTMDDLLSVVEGTTATVNVLTNDDFVPGANTSITQTGGTAMGTVVFDPLTGELDYTPAAGEEGTIVTVIYQVCHTGVAPNVCEDATVNITVQTDTDDDGTPDVTDTDDDNDGNPDVSDPNPLVPTTMDDLLTVVEGTTATVNVLTNDDFVSGVNTSITQTGGTATGTVVFDPLTGELDYTPAAGEEGTTVTVIYQVCHTGVAPNVCEDATVSITVQTDTDDDGTPDVTDTDDDNDGNPDVSDPNPLVPTTMDDLLAVVEGTTATVNVLTNDDFLPGVNTAITDTGSGTATGTITFDPLTGEMFYIAASGEGGTTVTVIYQVCNTAVIPNVCTNATVTITVEGDDSDGDGIPNSIDLDDDNDGIPDTVEQGGNPTLDTDGDGIIDSLDLDSDGDGVLDLIESGNEGLDVNNDGQLDGPFGIDGIADDIQTTPDNGEVNFTPMDSDGDGISDFQDIDDDGDGVDTINEDVDIDGSPIGDDSDGDGIPNYLDTDDDGDGILTEDENPNSDEDGDPLTGDTQDSDNDGIADYLDIDDDGDGINTIEEDVNGDGDPTNDDTDGDNIPDYLDIDDDGDGINIDEETSDPNGDGIPDDASDVDGDGIPDYLEPNNVDTNVEDELEVFNVVTPNGDGDHDVLVIRNIENFPANELKIFNRWGVLVYDALGYGINGEYFRGESNGRATISKDRQLPVGTYFYVLTYKTNTGETKKRSDYLYINR